MSNLANQLHKGVLKGFGARYTVSVSAPGFSANLGKIDQRVILDRGIVLTFILLSEAAPRIPRAARGVEPSRPRGEAAQHEQQELVRRLARTKKALLPIKSAVRQLLADDHFATLLRAEGLDELPEPFVERQSESWQQWRGGPFILPLKGRKGYSR
jgi:hypothetical protein